MLSFNGNEPVRLATLAGLGHSHRLVSQVGYQGRGVVTHALPGLVSDMFYSDPTAFIPMEQRGAKRPDDSTVTLFGEIARIVDIAARRAAC
jgi:hypothetical protein